MKISKYLITVSLFSIIAYVGYANATVLKD